MFLFQKNRNKSSTKNTSNNPNPQPKRQHSNAFQRVRTGPKTSSPGVIMRPTSRRAISCSISGPWIYRNVSKHSNDCSWAVPQVPWPVAGFQGVLLVVLQGVLLVWYGGSSVLQMLVVRKHQLYPLKLRKMITKKWRRVWKERWFNYHKNPSYTPVSSWQKGVLRPHLEFKGQFVLPNPLCRVVTFKNLWLPFQAILCYEFLLNLLVWLRAVLCWLIFDADYSMLNHHHSITVC